MPKLLRREYADVVPGFARADLLHSFLERCGRLLTADGALGFVTADRWLFNAGAQRLRAELGGLGLVVGHLARLDAATTFYRAKTRRSGTPPRIHPVEVVLRKGADVAGVALSGRAIFPDVAIGDELDTATLGSIATVRIAPWLGTFGVFVVDRVTAAALPRDQLVAAIDTDDLAGDELRAPSRFAIRTQRETKPSAAVMRHIDAARRRLLRTGRLCDKMRRQSPVWVPPESFEHISLSARAIVVPRIVRELRAVAVPAGVLAINHNLTIVMPPPHLFRRGTSCFAFRRGACVGASARCSSRQGLSVDHAYAARSTPGRTLNQTQRRV